MSSYNNCVLIGHMCRDIETKTTPGGVYIGKGSSACNRKRGDKEEVDYFDFVAFNRTAEVLEQFAGKGAKVLFQGELQQERWEGKDGQKKSKHVLYLNKITLLGEKTSNVDAVENVIGSEEDVPF